MATSSSLRRRCCATPFVSFRWTELAPRDLGTECTEQNARKLRNGRERADRSVRRRAPHAKRGSQAVPTMEVLVLAGLGLVRGAQLRGPNAPSLCPLCPLWLNGLGNCCEPQRA